MRCNGCDERDFKLERIARMLYPYKADVSGVTINTMTQEIGDLKKALESATRASASASTCTCTACVPCTACGTRKEEMDKIARALYPHKRDRFAYNIDFMLEEIVKLRQGGTDQSAAYGRQLEQVKKEIREDFKTDIDRLADVLDRLRTRLHSLS